MHLSAPSADSMQCLIEHVREPRRLILAWQAPDQFGERFRWAIGVVSPSQGDYAFQYLKDDEFAALNQMRTPQELSSLGYRGFTVFGPNNSIVYTKSVLSPFLRRLPPRSRTDFGDYLQSFRISRMANVSDFALLGLTEAKLPSDGFSLVDEYADREGERELLVELAGHRYYRSKLKHALRTGEPVELEMEPSNPYDPNAIVVRYFGEPLGYINRLQASAFREWIVKRRVQAHLEKLNGTESKPRAFIFAKISA